MKIIMEDGVCVAGFPQNKVESLCVVSYENNRFYFFFPESDELYDTSHCLIQPAAQRVLDAARS